MQEPCLLQICPEAGLCTISRALWCGSSPLTIYDEIVEATERGNSAVKQETPVEVQSFFTKVAVLAFIQHPSHHSDFIIVPPVRGCLLDWPLEGSLRVLVQDLALQTEKDFGA